MPAQVPGNAYEALAEEQAQHERWAFGTGFADPLSGVDTTVPDGVDGAGLAVYCVMLGDDALIFSHRLTEWVTRAPELEDEVALANIALDSLGQARLLLARAGQADGSGRSEDDLAYFREETEFRNVRLSEVPHRDFAQMIAALLVFATWRLAVFGRLTASRDPVLAAVASQGVKELTYHRDYAARWVVTLGCGTPESKRRVSAALTLVSPYIEELFVPTDEEIALAAVSVGVDPRDVRDEFDGVLQHVLHAAELSSPSAPTVGTVGGRAGRRGVHSEAMGALLAEMQSVARAHPEGLW
jgi:ring-1,2-phenylacetyl-CoA epoxidase subunit PaaC